MKKDYYDQALLEDLQNYEARKHRILKTLEEDKPILAKMQLENKIAEKTKMKLEAKLLKVFTFKHFNGSGVGFRFKLEYLDPCPKFDESCPLPAARKKHLRAIVPAHEFPQACVEYLKVK
jgi:hypothetical protein